MNLHKQNMLRIAGDRKKTYFHDNAKDVWLIYTYYRTYYVTLRYITLYYIADSVMWRFLA